MVHQPEGINPELWLSDVVEILLPEFQSSAEERGRSPEAVTEKSVARTIQEYTRRGIITPLISAVGRGGRNTYGRTELVMLAVTKALAESGMLLDEIRRLFEWLLSSPAEIDKFETIPQRRGGRDRNHFEGPLQSLYFDPFPEDEHVKIALTDQLVDIIPPQFPEGWPGYWERVRHLIRAFSGPYDRPARSALLLKDTRTLKVPDDVDLRMARLYPAHAVQRLVWGAFRVSHMTDVATTRLVDLASIKSRIGRKLLAREVH
ncbi:MerR family transcriptional regulator [Gemmatimonadota bacterium]